MKVLRVFLQFVLVVGALGAGAYGVQWYTTHRKEAKRAPVTPRPPLVEVMRARASDETVTVRARGTVVPAVQIEVHPEVSGRIVSQSHELIPGGRFAAKDVVVQIDKADYEFAVDQAEAALEKARFALKQEKGRAAVAQREWTLLDREIKTTDEGRALALREPHLKYANAAVAAAESALKKAELDRDRTTVRAPFNALVLKESVDAGQLVTPQTRMATLVGTDAFHVLVSAPVERLAWIRIPEGNGSDGSEATVELNVGNGRSVRRKGRVVRLVGDISSTGRMARLLVEVADPLELNRPKGARGLPLLLGASVEVAIEGRKLRRVFELPRAAVREGNRLWVLDHDGKLAIRPVHVAWGRPSTVLVDRGVSEGERVITSRLATPLPGMTLRTADAEHVFHRARARRRPRARSSPVSPPARENQRARGRERERGRAREEGER